MSLLAIDIGNTRTKIGLFETDVLAVSWAPPTPSGTTTDDEVARLVAELLGLDGRAGAAIDAVAIASVVPSVTPKVETFARRRLGVEPLVVEAASVSAVLPIALDRPDEVGADRLVNALAARELHGRPAIVIDAGTATTFDAVDADGAFIGGAIAAGPSAMLDAMRASTARLPRVPLRRPPRVIGSDTVSAMQSGAVNGYLGLVTGLLTAVRGELVDRSPAGARVTVVLTGGLATEPWLRDVPGIDVVEPQLTLHGLRLAHALLAGRTVDATR